LFIPEARSSITAEILAAIKVKIMTSIMPNLYFTFFNTPILLKIITEKYNDYAQKEKTNIAYYALKLSLFRFYISQFPYALQQIVVFANFINGGGKPVGPVKIINSAWHVDSFFRGVFGIPFLG